MIPDAKIRKYIKILRMAYDPGTTDGERTSAHARLEHLRTQYPGIHNAALDLVGASSSARSSGRHRTTPEAGPAEAENGASPWWRRVVQAAQAATDSTFAASILSAAAQDVEVDVAIDDDADVIVVTAHIPQSVARSAIGVLGSNRTAVAMVAATGAKHVELALYESLLPDMTED